MSKQTTKRENAIVTDFDSLEKNAAKAVSDLATQTAILKVY